MNQAQAIAILNAGIGKATELGVPMTIAVVDGSADLVAQVRMEGTYRHTVEISRGKAMVSAILLQPSGAVSDDNAVTAKLNKLHHDQFVFVQGAVPLFVDGVPVGAVGASGGLPEMDEQVATAAASVLD
ncbi:hypothetical protein B1R94_28865 [Mycolicibacterium litorale]|nr:hypothetical protein B1R94_28865 [Mycolicibacterium litorale]